MAFFFFLPQAHMMGRKQILSVCSVLQEYHITRFVL